MKGNVVFCLGGKGCKFRVKRVWSLMFFFCYFVKFRGEFGWEFVFVLIGRGEYIRDEIERVRAV